MDKKMIVAVLVPLIFCSALAEGGVTMCGRDVPQTGAKGDSTRVLSVNKYTNEIMTVAYEFCDIAFGCAGHKMAEVLKVDKSKVNLTYDCQKELFETKIGDGAVKYQIFTDDLLLRDITSSDGTLAGQRYMGTITIGETEYQVVDGVQGEKTLTIADGVIGTAAQDSQISYAPPLEDFPELGDEHSKSYTIGVIGAQTVEGMGVVDVTLEVTNSDGVTEEVTSGISGTPIVGDLKIKLLRGTMAENMITGEIAITADLLVWFAPSEVVLENGGKYYPKDYEGNYGYWELKFNGGSAVAVSDLKTLEGSNKLVKGVPMPKGVSENKQWNSCYKYSDFGQYGKDPVVRYLEFTLRENGEPITLSGMETLQLPLSNKPGLSGDSLVQPNFSKVINCNKNSCRVRMGMLSFDLPASIVAGGFLP